MTGLTCTNLERHGMQWHTGETRASQTRLVHEKVWIDQVSGLHGQGSPIGENKDRYSIPD